MSLKSRVDRLLGVGPSDDPRVIAVAAKRVRVEVPVVSTPGARVRVERTGYGAEGQSSLHPLDAKLNLPDEVYAHELRRRLGARPDVQVCLLGMWCEPVMPHLHDPFTLSDGYFDSCFIRDKQATANLSRLLPNARAGGTAAEKSARARRPR